MEYTVNLGKESLKRIADAISGGVEVEPLQVTENGEYTAPDGKAYSPVSVNVAGGGGSSDFSTAEVTLIGDLGGYKFPLIDPNISEGTPDIYQSIACSELIGSSVGFGQANFVVLHNGVCAVPGPFPNLTITGNAAIEELGEGEESAEFLVIRGNCTITVA